MPNRKRLYKVGFRKPPKAGQFKSGVSGNPKGRPKGSKNFKSVLAKELSGKVPVTENGNRQHVTKLAVVAKQLVNKAAAGDTKSIQTLIKHAETQEVDAEWPNELDILAVLDTREHHLVMTEIVRRIRMTDEISSTRKGR